MKNSLARLFEDIGRGMIACGVGIAVAPHITLLRRPTEPSKRRGVPRHRPPESAGHKARVVEPGIPSVL
jgi:hypothetical protein